MSLQYPPLVQLKAAGTKPGLFTSISMAGYQLSFTDRNSRSAGRQRLLQDAWSRLSRQFAATDGLLPAICVLSTDGQDVSRRSLRVELTSHTRSGDPRRVCWCAGSGVSNR